MFSSISAMYPVSIITDLSAVDMALKATELQILAIKDRLREEFQVIPKAKILEIYVNCLVLMIIFLLANPTTISFLS